MRFEYNGKYFDTHAAAKKQLIKDVRGDEIVSVNEDAEGHSTYRTRSAVYVIERIDTVETIDITPTWSALIPAICAVIEDGSPEGRKAAKEELMRLAQLADDYNAKNKKAA